jgi:hypothetical protein
MEGETRNRKDILRGTITIFSLERIEKEKIALILTFWHLFKFESKIENCDNSLDNTSEKIVDLCFFTTLSQRMMKFHFLQRSTKEIKQHIER